jgi:hypothetical protein
MRVRLSNVLAAVALPAACVVLAGCGQVSASGTNEVFSVQGSKDGKTIAPDGAAFSYAIPAGFQVEHKLRVRNAADDSAYRTAVSIARFDMVMVTEWDTRTTVTADNAGEVEQGLQAQLSSDFQAQGVGFSDWTTGLTVDGRPAVSFQMSNVPRLPGSPPITIKKTIAFDGAAEVVVSCQWTATRSEQVQAGCQQVLDSMQLR